MAKAGGNLLNTYVADYVVFDLETTGISPKTDEVVEISAVKVEHGKVTDEFSTLVNPKRRIPYGASRVNGITDDMVAEAPFFEQVLEEFLERKLIRHCCRRIHRRLYPHWMRTDMVQLWQGWQQAILYPQKISQEQLRKQRSLW